MTGGDMNEKNSTGVKLPGLTAILVAMLGLVTPAHSDSECNCATGTCANCNSQKTVPGGTKPAPDETKKADPVELKKNSTRFELPGSRHYRRHKDIVR
jgi:hypothetical protein